RVQLRAAAPALARGERGLGGQVPHAAAGLHRHAAAAERGAAVRLARLDPLAGDRRAGRLLRRRLLPQQHLLAGRARAPDGRPLPAAVRALRPRAGRARDRRPRRPGVHAQEQPGRDPRVPAVLRQRPGVRARPVAGGVHGRDPADRGQPAAGHRPHARLPRRGRRLPAAAVPGRPRRAAAEDRPGADGHSRRAGRPGAAQGVRGAAAGRRAGGAAHPRLAGRRRGRRARRRGGPMTTRKVAVIAAGVSTPSSTRMLADRLAAAIGEELRSAGVPAQVEIVELREHARALADAVVTGFAAGDLRDAIRTVTAADAVVAVTPVFAASYSGLFKTFVDVLEPDALAGKPVLLVATGVFAAPEDWAGGDAAPLSTRIERAARELTDLLTARAPVPPADPFADP